VYKTMMLVRSRYWAYVRVTFITFFLSSLELRRERGCRWQCPLTDPTTLPRTSFTLSQVPTP